MFRKLAIKKLTSSDLTFFVWHFRNRPAGNQKAINLNADVFVDRLYPSLPETNQAKTGRIHIDLYLYGPGARGEINIQRKIVGTGSYKNWRLNGEFVDDPEHAQRFSSLMSGDFVVFEFMGDLCPTAARAIFISRAEPEDVALHSELERLLTGKSMIAVEPQELGDVIARANIAASHPIRELILDDALEDVALGGSDGVIRLLRRRSGRKLSKDQLVLARERADKTGEQGEVFVNSYLQSLQSAGLIQGFEWISQENSISPYDFHLTYEASEVVVDAKSTTGSFDRKIHISRAELDEMAHGSRRYDLYRVFDMTDTAAEVRIAHDTRDFAARILHSFESLPEGVVVDAVSVDPLSLPFRDAITVVLRDENIDPAEDTDSVDNVSDG